MKTINFKSGYKKLVAASALFLFTVLLVSCENKINFLTSAVVPAARGYVTVKTDKNKNYVINIHVSDLAESTRLSPPKQTYVVWLTGVEGTAQNIGQIQTSKLSAALKTVSPYKPNKVFITAEDEANAQYPGKTVLTTENF
ncbi:hypothetical protein BH11BAC2_BH11BAC2_16110 [soil metagenome]